MFHFQFLPKLHFGLECTASCDSVCIIDQFIALTNIWNKCKTMHAGFQYEPNTTVYHTMDNSPIPPPQKNPRDVWTYDWCDRERGMFSSSSWELHWLGCARWPGSRHPDPVWQKQTYKTEMKTSLYHIIMITFLHSKFKNFNRHGLFDPLVFHNFKDDAKHTNIVLHT